jgi:uncharacterized protein
VVIKLANRRVNLVSIFTDSVVLKHLPKAGFRHSVETAKQGFTLAMKKDCCIDMTVKACLLHDVGHTIWRVNGKWDYDSYKYYDIHPIKGAERAHELLTLKGENLCKARQIALAILFHSDSSFINTGIKRNKLQQIVAEADNLDSCSCGQHHNNELPYEELLEEIRSLDRLVEEELKKCHGVCEQCPKYE